MRKCTNCERMLTNDRFGTKSWTNKDGSLTRTFKSHCRECVNKSNLKRYHENASTRVAHLNASYRHRIRKYGLTVEQYEQMLEDQNHSCYVCKSKPEGMRLNINHCHRTGKVRSLLCHNCNTALGHVNDNVDRLKLLINYLEEKNE